MKRCNTNLRIIDGIMMNKISNKIKSNTKINKINKIKIKKSNTKIKIKINSLINTNNAKKQNNNKRNGNRRIRLYNQQLSNPSTIHSVIVESIVKINIYTTQT
jgi:hypothetical protein